VIVNVCLQYDSVTRVHLRPLLINPIFSILWGSMGLFINTYATVASGDKERYLEVGSCLEKEIMQGTMPGARRRGRPCTAWMDNIKTWTGLPVEESIRMTEDRAEWRMYVHGVANPRIGRKGTVQIYRESILIFNAHVHCTCMQNIRN